METKKFKVTSNNGENGSRIKAGKNNTQTILTGAGIIGAAAVGAAAGYASGGSSDEEEPAESEKMVDTHIAVLEHEEEQ